MRFNPDFYPTPSQVIDQMIEGLTIEGKRFLEPSAGSGNIVDRLTELGAADVIACENDKDLLKILHGKCQVVAHDFFTLRADQVSHIDAIVMNPPFSNADDHILHAIDIAPAGCVIRALCNTNTIKNPFSKKRQQLGEYIKMHGDVIDLGDCFAEADRKTGVEVSLIRLQKPANGYEQEFSGFFMDDDPQEQQTNGLMSYNAIRDLVNRYVESVKIFDQQLDTAVRLNEMQRGYFDAGKTDLCISITRNSVPVQRNEFKKSMQRAGWNWVFSKLNMEKLATSKLREDINKFIEKQSDVPFTMRNIYHMLDIVIGTTESRMNKAIEDVFDRIVGYSDDNRHSLTGWKTNSHYVLNRRFILPNISEIGWSGEVKAHHSGTNVTAMGDMLKAICYITGKNYDNLISLYEFLRNRYYLVKDGELIKYEQYSGLYSFVCADKMETIQQQQAAHPGSEIIEQNASWGGWFDWGLFRVRLYKKGTGHFEFKDEAVWAAFNQRVAKIKGYPLPEKKEQTDFQRRAGGYKADKTKRKQSAPKPGAPKVLATIRINAN